MRLSRCVTVVVVDTMADVESSVEAIMVEWWPVADGLSRLMLWSVSCLRRSRADLDSVLVASLSSSLSTGLMYMDAVGLASEAAALSADVVEIAAAAAAADAIAKAAAACCWS